MRLRNFVFILSFTLALMAPISSWAAKVKKVKGTSVLIDSEASNLKAGALYYLVRNGKKKAIIKVLKVRPGQAIGKILKGKASPGLSLVRRPSKKKNRVAKKRKRSEPLPQLKAAEDSYSEPSKSSSNSSSSRLSIGLVASFGQDSAKVDFPATGASSSGSGSSTSFELIADYKYTSKISFRGSLGQQSFSTEDTGTQIVGSGANAIIDLSYINLDLWGKYHFTPRYWAGAGLGLLLSPSYGATTAVEEDGLGESIYLQVGGGVDFNINDKYFVPLWAEYGTFLESGDASISSIAFKAGISMRL